MPNNSAQFAFDIKNIWIHLLELYKKPSRFADKSMPWKTAFPQSWGLPLPALQPAEVVDGCRPRLEPNLPQPLELVGQSKRPVGKQRQQRPRKKVESHLPGERGFPN